MATGDPRLNRVEITALADPGRELIVSSVVAFEFADLQKRGRFAVTESLEFLRQHMEFRIVDLPSNCWRLAAELPAIHGDPVDRMLIAHAILADMTLATADTKIRRYPVDFI